MVVNGCEWISSESELISIHFSFPPVRLALARRSSHTQSSTFICLHLESDNANNFRWEMPWMLMWMWC